MNNDNKSSSNLQVPNSLETISHPFGTHLVPIWYPELLKVKSTMQQLMSPKFSGVSKQTVEYWRKREWFTADKRTHDGVYFYEIEQVMQLKEVYHPNWTRGGY